MLDAKFENGQNPNKRDEINHILESTAFVFAVALLVDSICNAQPAPPINLYHPYNLRSPFPPTRSCTAKVPHCQSSAASYRLSSGPQTIAHGTDNNTSPCRAALKLLTMDTPHALYASAINLPGTTRQLVLHLSLSLSH